MQNRLAHESSLYLRQHQEQPVDWYPWGPEALNRAKAEDRPILLSVGYSACHWCHVMAHESFDDPEIAALMNANFINIKVDREERPDLDAIYQNVAQIFTRGGGWPLTVFLTPEQIPFFGGTYFPPDDRHGRAGFRRVLTGLSDAFQKDRGKVQAHAAEIADLVREMEKLPSKSEGDSAEGDLLQRTAEALRSRLDPEWGGFGSAPKFPNPTLLQFLWRTQDAVSQSAVVHTLVKMIGSGTFDQVGGGFHRYATDRHWLTPHFEKMLYDNALLTELLAEILRSQGRLGFIALDESVRRELTRGWIATLEYLNREMWDETAGQFWTAQDADSDGHEGTFYTWTESEVRAVLNDDEWVALAELTDWQAAGNFEGGRQILTLRRGLKVEQASMWERIRFKLYASRSQRIWPERDEKSILGWNAMAASALAESIPLIEIELPERAASLRGQLARLLQTWQTLAANQKFWPHSVPHREPEHAFLDDLGLFARALIKAAEVFPDDAPAYWDLSKELTAFVVTHAWDDSLGACRFRVQGEDASRSASWVESYPIHDQATPAGNAAFFEVLSAHVASGEAPVEWMAIWEQMKDRAKGWVRASMFGSGTLASALKAIHDGGPWVVSGPVPESLDGRNGVWVHGPSKKVTSGTVQVCVPGRCYES